MDILGLIKKRCSTRKYQDKPVPKEILDKIIEAGVWGPSVMGVQPWRFVVITNKDVMKKIYTRIHYKAKQLGLVGRFVLSSAMNAFTTASVFVAVYNTGEFNKMIKKVSKEYSRISKLTEIQASAAAIQNMLLLSEELGIGSCWLDAPVYYENDINGILKINDKLLAFLTFGYPAEKGGRSKRKKTPEMVQKIS